MTDPTQQSEMQQTQGEDEAQTAEDFTSVLATLPPIQQWSSETVESLKSAVNNIHAEAKWQEDSIWTRRLINAIVAPEEGWDWQRLQTCSNADYFSLPTHTISLLNTAFHTNALHTARARTEAGHYKSPLNLSPIANGNVGYPIFRLDYSSDEQFELYKKCWDYFLETEFYVPEAVDPDDITWYWVDDKARLDGKDTREVRKLFQELCTTTFPPDSKFLWLCLTVDREAIESMLRVYGPPAKQVIEALPLSLASVRTKEISFLPYVTAVDTTWSNANSDETTDPAHDESQVNDGKYRGQFKCALRSVFRLWQNEQSQHPWEYYPKNGKIWGDNGIVFEAPLLD